MAKKHIRVKDNFGFGQEPFGAELTHKCKVVVATKSEIEELCSLQDMPDKWFEEFNLFEFPSSNFLPKNIHIISLKNQTQEIDFNKTFKNGVITIRSNNSDPKKYYIKAGNFIGVIYDNDNNLKIEITSRFGRRFLQHILNYINDIFIPDFQFSAQKENNKEHNQFQFILAHLFIQSLEKATAVFGLPKVYTRQHLHSYKIRGKLNIQKLISQNTPLRGKLHSTYNEQAEVQEIIDVLNKTISLLDKKFENLINSRLLSIKSLLKEKKSMHFVGNRILQKALNHKVLIHPSYRSFKQVLKYAELIINNYDMAEDEKGVLKSKAYLLDVSELFEIYLEKVLRRGLEGTDWSVDKQEKINTYEDTFFERNMRPDIVLNTQIAL